MMSRAALVEEAAAAAQSLEEQATHLQKAVSVFTLADMEPSVASIAILRARPALPAPVLQRRVVRSLQS
jgi:methyl-accepting chemotaxis protein